MTIALFSMFFLTDLAPPPFPRSPTCSALGLNFGAGDTFFNPATPYAILDRLAFKADPRAGGSTLGGAQDLGKASF